MLPRPVIEVLLARVVLPRPLPHFMPTRKITSSMHKPIHFQRKEGKEKKNLSNWSSYIADHYTATCNHNTSVNPSGVAKQQATNSHPLLLSDFLFSQCFSLCSTYSVLIVQYLSLRFFLWKVIFFREKFKIKSTLEKLTNS